MLFKRSCYFRPEGDWAILANSKGNIISVNKFATIILELMSDDWITVKNLAKKLLCVDDYFKSMDKEYLEDIVLSFINDMIKEEMIVSNQETDYDENVEISKVIFNTEQQNSVVFSNPLMSIVEITNRCNQNCKFCYVDLEKEGRIAKDPKLSDLFVICDELIKHKIFTINFLGGEPILRFDDLICLIKYVNSKNSNIHCTFATNGSADGGITKERALQLSKLKNISIRISIHGYKKDHDEIVGMPSAYNIALQSLRNLLKYAPNVLVSVATTISKNNINNIEKMLYDLFVNVGVQSIEIVPIQPVGQAKNNNVNYFNSKEEISVMNFFNMQSEKWSKKNKYLVYGSKYNEYVKPLKFKNEVVSCGIKHSIYIDTKGDCYVCHMSVGYDEFKIGNIYTTELDQMWVSKNRKKLISALSPSEICSKCNVHSCTNGCIVAAYINNGSLNEIDPCCPWINRKED